MAARSVPADHPPFAALPVSFVTVGGAEERLAVHVAGRLVDDRLSVVCLLRYTLNVTTVSGISVVSDPTASEPKYELLQADRVYTVATTDYLANVATGTLLVTFANSDCTSALVKYLRKSAQALGAL